MDFARAVGGPFKAGMVMVAAGLLAAACATPPRESRSLDVAGMSTVPAPRSTLVSRPDLRFSVAQQHRPDSDMIVLLHDASAGQRVPVATITSARSDDTLRISVQLLPLPQHDDALELAVLEHLYVLAVQQEPRAEFCLAAPGHACVSAKGRKTHAQMLEELVEARQRALRASPSAHAVPWRFVTMAPASGTRADADHVAVRVMAGDRPLPGASIHFSRAPHSGCVAKSDAQGIAACALVDYHGDDGDGDEGRTPVVATFAGDVRSEQALVPNTFVLPLHAPQSFARDAR